MGNKGGKGKDIVYLGTTKVPTLDAFFKKVDLLLAKLNLTRQEQSSLGNTLIKSLGFPAKQEVRIKDAVTALVLGLYTKTHGKTDLIYLSFGKDCPYLLLNEENLDAIDKNLGKSYKIFKEYITTARKNSQLMSEVMNQMQVLIKQSKQVPKRIAEEADKTDLPMKDKIAAIEITRENMKLLASGAEDVRVEEARLRTLINEIYQTVYKLLLEKDGYVKDKAIEAAQAKRRSSCDIFQHHWKDEEDPE